MLTELEQTKRALAGKHRAIDDWLDARQALLVEYMRLAGLTPPAPSSARCPAMWNCKASVNAWSTTSAPDTSRSTTTW